jgi:hypothetical protein
MMKRMMRRPIDDGFERVVHNHVAIVDGDRPKVDKDEQAKESELVYRKDVDEDMVGNGLEEAVDGVKSMRRPRCRN